MAQATNNVLVSETETNLTAIKDKLEAAQILLDEANDIAKENDIEGQFQFRVNSAAGRVNALCQNIDKVTKATLNRIGSEGNAEQRQENAVKRATATAARLKKQADKAGITVAELLAG